MQHGGRAGLREHLPPSPPPSASPASCVWPPLRARAREVAGGCARSCSFCSLTPVAAPTHCTPASPSSHRSCSLALSFSLPPSSCLSVSLALLSGFYPLRSLVVWFLSTGASRGPAGSKVLPCSPRLPLAQPPDGRARICLLCCCCRMDPRPSAAAASAAAA